MQVDSTGEPPLSRTATGERTGDLSGSTGWLVLASGSPRRLELLRSAGFAPQVVVGSVDETPLASEAPGDYVARLARDKAQACEVSAEAVVVAADTTVDLDGAILAKPESTPAARGMLEALSARTHLVHTGVAVSYGRSVEVTVVTTEVTFAHLDPATLDWYVGTGEPLDKAGGYAIQGSGARLVERVSGSVSNVIGLPLVETISMIARAGGG